MATDRDDNKRERADGEIVRVRLTMMDANPEVRAAWAGARDAAVVVDSVGRTAGFRSGYCFAAGVDRAEVTKAHGEMVRGLNDSWRGSSAEGPGDTGQSERTPQARSVADAEAIKQAAYGEMVAGLSDAWRGEAA